MKGQPNISSIYRQANADRSASLSEVGRVWALCKDAWVNDSLLLCRPAEMPADLARQVVAWATETYGERAKRK